jgi:hypothetical protein
MKRYRGLVELAALFMFTIIVIISGVDTYLLSKNREMIHLIEENPIGLWLISMDSGDVSLFIAVKFVGTFLVIFILGEWIKINEKTGLIATMCITIGQILLLSYLMT